MTYDEINRAIAEKLEPDPKPQIECGAVSVSTKALWCGVSSNGGFRFSPFAFHTSPSAMVSLIEAFHNAEDEEYEVDIHYDRVSKEYEVTIYNFAIKCRCSGNCQCIAEEKRGTIMDAVYEAAARALEIIE
jgi:hypothetical protein